MSLVNSNYNSSYNRDILYGIVLYDSSSVEIVLHTTNFKKVYSYGFGHYDTVLRFE